MSDRICHTSIRSSSLLYFDGLKWQTWFNQVKLEIKLYMCIPYYIPELERGIGRDQADAIFATLCE